MPVLDPSWTPIAGYSHIPELLARLAEHDSEDEFVGTMARTGVDSHTPTCTQGRTSGRKEDANP